ncbi:hypothetical protein HY634_01255 [Candidatus Uhrbacteria bacterium]|nr:hypothetical protein [Candidatus Uhrbacteria bacterium]
MKRIFPLATFVASALVSSSLLARDALAGMDRCGGLKLAYVTMDPSGCDPADYLVATVTDEAGREVLTYRGPAPADHYWTTVVNEEAGIFAGIYLDPRTCAWTPVYGTAEEIAAQIEAGEDAPAIAGIRIIKYKGTWSQQRQDCVSGSPTNCEGVLIDI